MVRHLKNTCAESISLLKCNLKTLERQNYPAKYFFVSFEVQRLTEMNITQYRNVMIFCLMEYLNLIVALFICGAFGLKNSINCSNKYV